MVNGNVVVRNYVRGHWQSPGDDGVAVYDAVHGEEIFRVSDAGPDLASVLDHGRRVGVPALRESGFLERAALLKDLARHLRGSASGFSTLAALGGGRPADIASDLEGGLSALRRYSGVAQRGLPAGNTLTIGPAESLNRDGSRATQQTATAGSGVAVQLNDFSLPLQTVLEKFAPAFLAGLPTVIRPASQTARLTAVLVEAMSDSGLLPEGALQLLCGSAGRGDRLGAHDVLCADPAGSAACAVLGMDAEPGGETFRGFVDLLVGGMTRWAGQTHSAVRHAFVPVHLVEAVTSAIVAELGAVVVGHPGHPDVRMGPLIDLGHREVVRRQISDLVGAADLVFGAPDHVDVVGADSSRGAFLSPMLLSADPAKQEIHRAVVFGPVSVLMPYPSAEALANLPAGGSLCTVVTGDGDLARDLTRAVAPFVDRVRLLDSGRVPDTTGDAECLRRVLNHLRVTTVEAPPRLLGPVTGTWVRGADRTLGGTHPLRRHLEELAVGDTLVAGPRKVTRADIAAFADLTGDHYYLHTDEAAAQQSPMFGGIIAHGYLVISLVAGLFVAPEPGPVLANYGLENLRFLAPVRPDDELTVTLTVKQVISRPHAASGEVRWDVEARNQSGLTVVRYDVLTLMAKRP